MTPQSRTIYNSWGGSRGEGCPWGTMIREASLNGRLGVGQRRDFVSEPERGARRSMG